MRSLGTGKVRAQLVTSVGMLALTAGAALAQQATPPVTPPTVVAQNAPDQQASAAGLETVVVSASRISIAGYTAPTPVSVIGAEAASASRECRYRPDAAPAPHDGHRPEPAKRHPGQCRQFGRRGHQQRQSAQFGRHPHPGAGRWRARSLGRRAIWRGPQHHSQIP